MKWIGIIVGESLREPALLKRLRVLKHQKSPTDGWELYQVELDQNQIKSVSAMLKPAAWYAHFWAGEQMIVVFPDRIFKFNHSDQASRGPVIAHGLKLGIPRRQLDFAIEEL